MRHRQTKRRAIQRGKRSSTQSRRRIHRQRGRGNAAKWIAAINQANGIFLDRSASADEKFDAVKDLESTTLSQMTTSQDYLDVIWPNYAVFAADNAELYDLVWSHVNENKEDRDKNKKEENEEINITIAEKANQNPREREYSVNFRKSKGTATALTNLLVFYLTKRAEKAADDSTGFKFSRLFSPEKRSEKLKTALSSVDLLIEALTTISRHFRFPVEEDKIMVDKSGYSPLLRKLYNAKKQAERV